MEGEGPSAYSFPPPTPAMSGARHVPGTAADRRAIRTSAKVPAYSAAALSRGETSIGVTLRKVAAMFARCTSLSQSR
jgi:hypothetical protein